MSDEDKSSNHTIKVPQIIREFMACNPSELKITSTNEKGRKRTIYDAELSFIGSNGNVVELSNDEACTTAHKALLYVAQKVKDYSNGKPQL